MRRKVLSILLIFYMVAALFAQEEDSDWFWNHEISKIEFEGLKIIKKAEKNLAKDFPGKDVALLNKALREYNPIKKAFKKA